MNTKFPVFNVNSTEDFELQALAIFRYQFKNNNVYRRYCKLLNIDEATSFKDIPYLPISFFKSHDINSQEKEPEITFTSSGTTGSTVSKHHVANLSVYDDSLDQSFKMTYGAIEEYTVLALLPHYLERTGSSLVYMVDRWITQSKNPKSGFYLNDLESLSQKLIQLSSTNQKVILIGVTFALLQLAEKFPLALNNLIIIETGGMKGMRKEIIKPELHNILQKSFPNAMIQSEYGMTELLSQAYAPDGINFITPPWMQVSTRDVNDPLSLIEARKTGGLNIIDLANYESCSFIATQDLGKINPNGSFQVLGRFDHSDIRGCNLMAL